MVALVVLTAFGVGALVHRNIARATVPLELDRLHAHTNQLAMELDAYVRETRADVFAAANSPAVREYVTARMRSAGVAESAEVEAWRMRIAEHFWSELSAKPQYLQFRMIGADDDGREIVRVDRSGADGSTRVLPDDELQAKGDRDYFIHAMAVERGEAYVSRIDLNQEHGKIEVPYVPVLRTAAPVWAEGANKPFGIIIINVDMRPILARMHSTLHPSSQVYAIGSLGHYIVNTAQPQRVFGLAGPADPTWRRDMPPLARAFDRGDKTTLVFEDHAGNRLAGALATRKLAGGTEVVLIETAPYAEVIALASEAYRSTLIGALIAVGCAIVAAVAIARSLVRPLAQMTHAVEAFAENEEAPLPVKARGEIGILSGAFAQMSRAIRARTEELRREIDVRRKTESALEKQIQKEQNFIAVVQSSADAIIAITLDGAITAWNPAAERMYGYTMEEAIGRNINFIVPPDRLGEVEHLLAEIAAGQRVDQFETVRRRKSGQLVDVSINVSPINSPNGEITGVSKIAHDISAQKHAIENFKLVVEASPSGVCVVDEHGKIVLVNEAIEELFGYRRAELLNQPVEMLVPSLLRTDHVKQRQAYTAAPKARAMGGGRELRGVRKDGSEISLEIGLNPIRSATGVRILCSIVDVTERLKAHRQLTEYASRLERSNADLEQFAYVVSHDIKAPLRGIASVADWLAHDFGRVVDDDGRENIALMLERTARLDKLIGGILDYSRAGQRAIQRVRVDVEELVGDIIKSVEPPERVKIRVDGPMPELLYDETQMRQVLQNLIVNAINHVDASCGEVTVSCTTDEFGAHFSVADNGVGIAEQHFERIFVLFQTLKPKDECKSAGAGLAIVKRIVERNGGTVTVNSEPGNGATFTFSVPGVHLISDKVRSEVAKA
ncbi:MAG: PAS domain S-box protein [Phycisphaerales bacterium]|nr:PAS domain S-box protein [Phycisphaerales bacterium]